MNKYKEWAKCSILDLGKTARALGLNKDPKVSWDLLDKERNTRSSLVTFITAITSLELFSEKLETTETAQLALKAIAQMFIPIFKPLFIDWVRAKLNVRKAILHHQDEEGPRHLLRSSLRDPSVFPKHAVDVLTSKNMQQLDAYRMLNLTADGNYSKPQSRFDYPSKSNSKSNRSYQQNEDHRLFRGFSSKRQQKKQHNPSGQDSRNSSKKSGETKSSKNFDSSVQEPSLKGKQPLKGRRRKFTKDSK